MAEPLAERAGTVEGMVRLVPGRAPSESEHRLYAEHVSRHGAATLARVLFNTNEFLFVD